MLTPTQSSARKRLLLCFSPKDSDGKAELEASLAPARRKLSIWSVDLVPAGASEPAAFREEVESSDAVLLLLSADFFADLEETKFADQVELIRQQHKERGLRLVPILWRDCDWQALDWMAKLKPLPGDGAAVALYDKAQRDQLWTEIAQELGGTGGVGVRGLLEAARSDVQVVMPNRDELIAKSLNLLAHIEEEDRECAVDVKLDVHRVPQLVEVQHMPHLGVRGHGSARPLTVPLLDYVLREERLLLVGDPGAGKTQTLYTLYGKLLAKAQADPRLPVPFLINLSTFNRYRGTLRDWLAEGLNECASISPEIGQALLGHGQVFLLLDDFDEIAVERRVEALSELNTLLRKRDPALARCIICGRKEEYQAAGVKLLLPAALELQSLLAEEVQAAVAQAGPAAAALRAAIDRDQDLVMVLKTPLLLAVAIGAFAGTPSLDLSGRSAVELRQLLYDAYIVRMLRRTTSNKAQPVTLTLRWLRWLARYLNAKRSSIFLLEWLQPALLTRSRPFLVICQLMWSMVAWLGVGLGVTLLHRMNDLQDGRLVHQINMRLYPWVHRQPLSTLCSMLGSRLSFVLACIMLGETGLSLLMKLVDRTPARLIVPVEHMRWSWSHAIRHWKSGLSSGLILGLLLGLVCGLTIYLHSCLLDRLDVGLSSGLILVLGWALVFFIIFWPWMTPPYFLLHWRKTLYLLRGIWGLILGWGCGWFLAVERRYLLDWLGMGLGFGLILGLAWAVIFIVNRGWIKTFSAKPVRPNEGIRASIQNGLKVLVSVGGSVGLVTGLVTGLALDSVSGFCIAVSSALISGFTGGLLGGLSPALRHYVLRWFLWRQGTLPLRLVPWLESGSIRPLLPRHGGAYRFWHVTLQAYFAKLDDVRLAELAKQIESAPV